MQLAPVDAAAVSTPASAHRRLSTVDASVPSGLVEPMRRALNVDVGGVAVRRGPDVDAVAAELGARGFTASGVVHIPDGAGPLDSTHTTPLVAHELTHAVQQQRFGTTLPSHAEDEAVAVEQWAESGFAGPPPVLETMPDPLDEWEAANAEPDSFVELGPADFGFTDDATDDDINDTDHPATALPTVRHWASSDPVAEWAAATGARAGRPPRPARPDSPALAPEATALDEWEAATTAAATTPFAEFGPPPGAPAGQATGLLAAYEGLRALAPPPQPPDFGPPDRPGSSEPPEQPEPSTPPGPTLDELVESIADDPPRRWLDLDDPGDFEEMANRLYNTLLGRLRFDVLVERERAGTLLDYR